MRASTLRLPLRNPSFQLARHLGREERGEAVWAGKAPQVPSAGGAPCLRRMGTSRRGKMEVTMKRIEMMMRGLGAGSGAPHRHCDCLRPRLQTTNNSLKLWVAWRHRVSALHYLTKHKQRRGSTALASARLHPAACACACGRAIDGERRCQQFWTP